MNKFGKRALCLLVCLAAASFLAMPAFAVDPWVDKGSDESHKGDQMKPEINSGYSAMPMMVDDTPWVDGRHRNGKPEDPVVPSINPLAWWMQMAVDTHPWVGSPPKKNSPME